ncbi:uncharacterized protein LOC127813504 [Diospyros lotus]|uniref:uncharacterized protein LOC127813504 n=1 Tax=Diospyros lotus TaxID=55363 RepID=UPI0022544236|nr:uncharacterized protein LOC127813504 [Diospyros lotus]
MGNCLFGGLGDHHQQVSYSNNNNNAVIKVVTSSGGIMEFNGPMITVECITDEFPGHGLFRSHDLFWKPLDQHEVLVAGESYYLLPLHSNMKLGFGSGQNQMAEQVGHVRSNSVPNYNSSSVVNGNNNAPPYRMSFEGQGMLKRSHTEVFNYSSTSTSRARCSSGHAAGGGGVWKVKLVISPRQLLEILSQEARTQELIESVRTVAKCGNVGVSSWGFSDQWSFYSSSRNNNNNNNASFKKLDGLLEM